MRPGTAQRGFTLAELLIVVAVIGILVAVAYPSYQDSVLKGRRTQARTALLELLQQQERYMTQRGTYLKFANVKGTTDPADAAATFRIFSGDDGSAPAYWLSADACDAGDEKLDLRSCIRLTATPTHTDTAVGSLRVTSTGVKECSGTTTNKRLCWP